MNAQDLLIPPQRVKFRPGRLVLTSPVVLASPSQSDLLPLGQLADDLAAIRIRSRIERNAFGPAAVRVRRVTKLAGVPGEQAMREAYRLVITPDGAAIEAVTDAGAYYGLQTLRDVLASQSMAASGFAKATPDRNNGRPARTGHAPLQCCEILDWPTFARRTVQHDVSRGKVPTVATVKELIERLARWRYNDLQLYIENVFTFKRHPLIGRGYSPYTPADILEIQDHCRKHHVRLVGELASFGHMEKILQHPQYQHLSELKNHWGLPGGATLCPTDPRSIRFIEELFEEFVPLFEAEDFNVCCDETFELGKGRTKALAAKIGVGRVYLDFLLKLRRLCEKHGKRMNCWADILMKHPELLPHVPKDIVVGQWGYSADHPAIARTVEVARSGIPFLVCPGTNAWLSNGSRMRAGMENIAAFARKGIQCGAQGVVVTDWGDEGHRNMLAISLHNFAYGGAICWNTKGVKDEGFARRFCRQELGDERLAEALTTLGSTDESVGVRGASTVIYRAFVGAFYISRIRDIKYYLLPDHHFAKAVDKLDLAKLAARHKELAGLSWPSPRDGANRFQRHTFAELGLGTQLEMASCRSAILLKQLRQGITPSRKQLGQYLDETASALPELKRVWMLRNRPSRLVDNVKGMKAAMKQYGDLVRKPIDPKVFPNLL